MKILTTFKTCACKYKKKILHANEITLLQNTPTHYQITMAIQKSHPHNLIEFNSCTH